MGQTLRRVLVGVVVLALIGLVAWAYSYVSPMTARGSDDWSRGMVIGRTPVNKPVSMSPAPGGGVYVIWSSVEGDLELVRIGIDGEVLLHRTLQVGSGDTGRDPQLQVGLDGTLHVAWRERGEPHATIRYVLLDAEGEQASASVLLSNPDYWVVESPQMVLDLQGQVSIFWADEIGIHRAVVDADGSVAREPTLLAPEGYAPAVNVDNNGLIHLAWQERMGYNMRGMYYATLDPDSGEMSEPEEMAQVFRRIGQSVKGPTIGMDEESGYIFWEVRDYRDVSRRGQYASFPLDLPRQKRAGDLTLERGYSPSELYPLAGQRDSLLVALSAEVTDDEFFSALQIMVVEMAPGETPDYEIWGVSKAGHRPLLMAPPNDLVLEMSTRQMGEPGSQSESEQVVTASNVPSMKPTLVMDSRYDLHVTWLESAGFRQYRVIYASTAPEVVENYGEITLFDIIDPLFRRLFRLSLVVLAAGPMFVMWALIPTGGLLLYHIVTGEEGLETVQAKIALGVAVVVEALLAYVFSPIATTSAWSPLRWITPLATLFLAAAITAYIVRKRQSPEGGVLLSSFLLFTMLFSLMQMFVYFML